MPVIIPLNENYDVAISVNTARTRGQVVSTPKTTQKRCMFHTRSVVLLPTTSTPKNSIRAKQGLAEN